MLWKLLKVTILMTLVLSACKGQAAPPVTELPPAATITPIPTTKVPPAVTQMAATVISTSIPPTNSPGCTDQAAFVADVTIPDNTKFNAGSAYTKTWRVKNNGTCGWTAKYSLAFASGYQSNAPDSVPLSYTAPGATLDISVDLTAPSKSGTANTFFELHNPAGVRFPIDTGVFLYVTIFVNPSVSAVTPANTSTSNSSAASSPGAVCAYTGDPSKVADVISALNSYRAQNNLPALTINSLLTQSAQVHSVDMACHNLFGHTGSDGSSAATRIAATGYHASHETENVYGSYPPLSGQGAISWWATDQTDPRHNQNLLTTKDTEIGVAYSFYNNYGYYVIDFASP
jgi:uncharacterized protein YkwD